MKKLFVLLCLLPLLLSQAMAQSNPGLVYGQVPTPAQWNGFFAAKQDYLGASPCLVTGCTMSGEIVTSASTTSSASFRIPPGIAPTTPVNGDFWTTNAGIFVQINGITVSPLITAGVGTNQTVLQGNASGTPTFVSTLPVTVQEDITATGTVTSGTWSSAIAGTITGNATLSGNLVFGATITAPSLSTPSSNIAGSLCATSGGVFLYYASNNCYAVSASAVTVGTTTIANGNSGYVLYQNGASPTGTIEELATTGSGDVVLAGSPTLSGTIAGALTFSGNITLDGTLIAASLSTPSSNIAGSLCATSGGVFLYYASNNCYAASASAVTIGTTTVTSGTAGALFYQNGASPTGTIGEITDVAVGSILASAGTTTVPAFSKTPQLGASGTLGSVTFGNATSGLLTLEPVTGALGTVTVYLPVPASSPDTLDLIGTAATITGTKTFNGTSSTWGAILANAAVPATVSATAATGVINFYVNSQSILYYTSNASADWTMNFAFSSGTTMNSAMAVGQVTTLTFLVTQGSTAYYPSAFEVDGTATGVTMAWQGGVAPSAGHATSIDGYTFSILKTASTPTYTIFASQVQF